MGKFQKGNKVAEKWPIESAQEWADKVLGYVQKKRQCYTISEAAVNCGQYRELIPYLNNKYPDTPVFHTLKKAEAICADRIVKGGLQGDLNPTMSIFILKCNHGFQDKQVIKYQEKEVEVEVIID